jgi:hypothetical protein
MWTLLVNESLDRTGRQMMAVSVVLGLLAGLAVSSVIHLTSDFWGNAGLLMLICGSLAFLINLLFISPIRLWQAAERQLTELRNSPPAGMNIQHVDQVINVHGSIGSMAFAVSSNSVIVGPDQEGILFPRGSVFQANAFQWDAFGIESTGISHVPPELLDKPPDDPPTP